MNGTSRRLVIFVTDAPFHIAGDGKVGIPVDNLTNMTMCGKFSTVLLLLGELDTKIKVYQLCKLCR